MSVGPLPEMGPCPGLGGPCAERRLPGRPYCQEHFRQYHRDYQRRRREASSEARQDLAELVCAAVRATNDPEWASIVAQMGFDLAKKHGIELPPAVREQASLERESGGESADGADSELAPPRPGLQRILDKYAAPE